jgi:predicted sugar kinase
MFGEAVYQFGKWAGECFSAVQGGPYASPEIERLVESIREYGVPGVGQSSWGPTVFAVVECDEEARRLKEWVRGQSCYKEFEITVARPNNSGARVETRSYSERRTGRA